MGTIKRLRPVHVLIPAAVLFAFLALVFLLGWSSDRGIDDTESLLTDYRTADFDGFTLCSDGTVTVRMEHDDICWFADRYGLFSGIRSGLLGGDGAEYGFRISGGTMTVSRTVRFLGLIPFTVRAEVGAASSGAVLTLTPRQVELGCGLPLPESLWPQKFRRSYTWDFSESGLIRDVISVHLEGSALVLVTEGLSESFSGQLRVDTELRSRLQRFGVGQDETGMRRWILSLPGSGVPMEEARQRILACKEPEEALAELTALCTEESRKSVFLGSGGFTEDFMGTRLQAEALTHRAAMESHLENETARYEKLLTAVREMYRGGRLTLTYKGELLLDNGSELDLSTLTTLSVSSTDARVVFLSADLSSGSEICTADMPELSTVPRKGALPGWLDGEQTYDLGIAMTTEGGEPVLVHYRQDGTAVISPLSNELYIGLLVSTGVRVLNIGEVVGK